MLALRELLHNLKDRDWDVNPTYKIDVNEAKKLIPPLERINRLIKLPEEVSCDDEIFKDDYADKNTQNGWIYCKDWRNIVFEARTDTDDVIAWMPLPKWEVEE